jgi:hypothetical protein
VAPGAAGGGRRAGAAPGAETAGGAPAVPDQNQLMSVMQAVMGRGGMGALFGGGGRRGGGAALVGTGDYLVTITAGGQTMKQVLHVERISGGEGGGFPFDEDDEHREP